MNKIKLTIAGLVIACFGFGITNAQNSAPTTNNGSAQTPAKKTMKKAPAAKGTNTTTPADKTAAKPAGPHMKKDGTPDMRYKENKTAKPAGTKASKTGTTTKKSTTKKAASATTPKKTAAPAKSGM